MFPSSTTAVAVLLAASLTACSGSTLDTGATRSTSTSSGVGDPCVLTDEARPGFSAYAASEVNIETRSPSCETTLCLANHFAGRTTCPYGGTSCSTTGTPPSTVTVSVPPQLVDRPPSSAVYCSCRCDGIAGSGPLCACPSGFSCEPLVQDFGASGDKSLAGSYCVKNGTEVKNVSDLESGTRCDATLRNCEDR
jgi:hypothetical protein